MFGRRRMTPFLAAIAIAAGVCGSARAEPPPPTSLAQDVAIAPAYTLEVDSDAPDVISFDALAARIASDLGADVVRSGPAPSRAAIAVRLRGRELVVRAVHAGGRVLERSMNVEGDAAAIQREAVLLASNLARDEAREILDDLAARPPPSPVAPPPASPPPSPSPAPPEDRVPLSVSLVYPLATNAGRPNIVSIVDLSLIYGRVGTIEGAQLGGAVVHASRDVSGAQLAGAVTITGGAMRGAQLAGGGTFASKEVIGAQLSGGANLALDAVDGAQLSSGFNLARGNMRGAQLTGGLNLATRELAGAQLAPINVAADVTGLQLGLINVARKVHGLQLGLINVAEDVDGAAVGLVSISRNSVHPIAWTSNLEYMNAGLKLSTKYVFTIAAVHYGTHEGDFDNVGVTGALGGHIPLPADFDVEVLGSVTHLVPRPSQKRMNGNLWVAPQVVAGYSIASHLRVFAGGGFRIPAVVDLGREVVRPEVLAGVQF